MFGNQLNGVTKVAALPYSLNDMIGIITLSGTAHHSDLKRPWIADSIGVGATFHLPIAASYEKDGTTIYTQGITTALPEWLQRLTRWYFCRYRLFRGIRYL